MKRFLKAAAAAVFWLAVWQLLAMAVGSELLLPEPLTVLRRLLTLARGDALWLAAAATFGRIALGLALGVALGLVLAAATSASSFLRALFSPLLTVIKSTPVVSFIILVLIWVGRNFVPVAISALMVLPVIWANVATGISGTDIQLLEMARVYRLRPSLVFGKIYVPSVLPHFLSACRSALGLAWKSGVTAEVLTVPRLSIGKRLYESKQYMETVDMFAWTVLVVICSLVIEKLLTSVLARIGGRYSGEADKT